MYSLRSRRSQPCQMEIEFPHRKRRREEKGKSQARPQEEGENESPLKKAKQDAVPSRRRSTRVTAHRSSPLAGLRSPLKDYNPPLISAAVATEAENHCGGEREFTPSPQKEPARGKKTGRGVAKRLDFSNLSALQRAKQSLHASSSSSSSLLCREDQLQSLSSFLSTHLTGRKPGALYISGAPGTGKTACLSHTLDQSQDLVAGSHVVFMNCMSIKSPQAVFSQLAADLLGSRAASKNKEQALVRYITSSKKMILVVLDEIDQLDSRSQEVLYSLFEWPALPNSKLVLIGIANALDLTDRVLPRLQSHIRCQPDLLHFPPYSKDQIVTILRSRVGGGGEGVTVVDPMAIQFVARKVAAVHGDIRKALDICRRAIDSVEIRQRSCSSSEQPVKVTLGDVATVILGAYGSTLSHSTRHTLPLQQKLIVCTLLLMVRGRSVKEVTMGGLMGAYVRMCRQRQLKAESETEFVGLCNMLEARGIIGLKRAREARNIKVVLKLEESELEHALQDRVLLSSVLEQGLPRS